jgi:hypothetical protein
MVCSSHDRICCLETGMFVVLADEGDTGLSNGRQNTLINVWGCRSSRRVNRIAKQIQHKLCQAPLELFLKVSMRA